MHVGSSILSKCFYIFFLFLYAYSFCNACALANTLRPTQNGCLVDYIFKYIFFKNFLCIFVHTLLKFVHRGPIAASQHCWKMAWHKTGDKPLNQWWSLIKFADAYASPGPKLCQPIAANCMCCVGAGASLVQAVACCLLITKPLPELMQTYSILQIKSPETYFNEILSKS